MRRCLLVAVLLLASPGLWAEETRDAAAFFDETFGDFEEELSNAREQDKQGILLMFEMDDCPFCHRMKRTVLNRASVQDYFHEHFLIFSVDTEGDLEITDFSGETTTQKDFALKQYRVRATPVFQFIDLEGNPVKRGRYTGATRDADEFLLLGEYIVNGHNAEQSFTVYKRDKQGSL